MQSSWLAVGTSDTGKRGDEGYSGQEGSCRGSVGSVGLASEVGEWEEQMSAQDVPGLTSGAQKAGK